MYKLEHLGKNDSAEELSGQFEGDIVMSEDQLREVTSSRRTSIALEEFHWKDGIIPYEFEEKDFSE